MARGKMIFDYMWKNEVSSHVEVDLDALEVKCEEYTTKCWNAVFWKQPHNIEYLNKFFESRCFPEHRADLDVLLELLGLQQYNPLDIVKITRGRMMNDFCWIRFEGDTAVWDEELGLLTLNGKPIQLEDVVKK